MVTGLLEPTEGRMFSQRLRSSRRSGRVQTAHRLRARRAAFVYTIEQVGQVEVVTRRRGNWPKTFCSVCLYLAVLALARPRSPAGCRSAAPRFASFWLYLFLRQASSKAQSRVIIKTKNADRMRPKSQYLLSLPERLLRSASA